MNVFVIHSGKDREEVEKKLSSIKQSCHSFNPLLLGNGGMLWKIDAKRKIKKAQMVVFFVGEASHTSKNIDWEICTAIKFQKPIYTVKLNEEFELNKALKVSDPFSGKKTFYSKSSDLDSIIELIKKHDSGEYKVFNQDPSLIDKTILLEQYKVFLH